mmetsp:Transcript_26658/g.53139  ORF Transcript_26658/g.53139 Transcript_26658/m.53139 type:complete len:217 (+) Transcript_26658:179-829(+)
MSGRARSAWSRSASATAVPSGSSRRYCTASSRGTMTPRSTEGCRSHRPRVRRPIFLDTVRSSTPKTLPCAFPPSRSGGGKRLMAAAAVRSSWRWLPSRPGTYACAPSQSPAWRDGSSRRSTPVARCTAPASSATAPRYARMKSTPAPSSSSEGPQRTRRSSRSTYCSADASSWRGVPAGTATCGAPPGRRDSTRDARRSTARFTASGRPSPAADFP